MKDQNLITLFRNYFKLGIPNYIGTTANSIFQGILYKFNEMGFPDSLKISNRELLTLSGISDIRTFRNARRILAQYLHDENDNESYLVRVEPNDIREYSIYYLNYVILQENYSKVTVKLQESYREISEIEKDRVKNSTDLSIDPAKNASLSDTILDNTKQDHLLPRESLSISTKKEIAEQKKEDDEEKRIKEVKKLVFSHLDQLTYESSFLYEDWQKIATFDDAKIKDVVLMAKRERIYHKRIAIYIMKGLDNYEAWYQDKNNGGSGNRDSGKYTPNTDYIYNMVSFWEKQLQDEYEDEQRRFKERDNAKREG